MTSASIDCPFASATESRHFPGIRPPQPVALRRPRAASRRRRGCRTGRRPSGRCRPGPARSAGRGRHLRNLGEHRGDASGYRRQTRTGVVGEAHRVWMGHSDARGSCAITLTRWSNDRLMASSCGCPDRGGEVRFARTRGNPKPSAHRSPSFTTSVELLRQQFSCDVCHFVDGLVQRLWTGRPCCNTRRSWRKRRVKGGCRGLVFDPEAVRPQPVEILGADTGAGAYVRGIPGDGPDAGPGIHGRAAARISRAGFPNLLWLQLFHPRWCGAECQRAREAALKDDAWGLLPAFLDGMLERPTRRRRSLTGTSSRITRSKWPISRRPRPTFEAARLRMSLHSFGISTPFRFRARNRCISIGCSVRLPADTAKPRRRTERRETCADRGASRVLTQ